jgi:hypothetical protein
MSVQLEQAKRSAGKFFRRVLWFLLIIFLLIGVGYFAYSQMTYSDGRKSGQLVKISHRGIMFKTYEGTLNLSPNGMMTAWDFSADNRQIADKLQQFEGKQVTVHYKQRYRVFFWQGDTDYIVDDVQAVSQ